MSKNKLVLFDLDHTLIACDSDSLWSQYLIDKKYTNMQDHTKKKEKFHHDYREGVLNMQEYLSFQLYSLTLFPKEQLDLMHQEFMQDYIIENIPQKSLELVNKHLAEQSDVILVSATNEFIITPIGHKFGINNIIGVQLETDALGNFTGNFIGTPSYREGKVLRVQKWLKEQGKSLHDYKRIYCYSDSHNDIPLLSIATDPFAVNPDSKLENYARENKWPIIYLY